MRYRTLNPATEERIETFPWATPEELERAVDRASAAFRTWRSTSLDERAARLLDAAHLLDRDARALAGLMALEMGKPLAQGAAEASKCAWGCRHFAANAAEFLADRPCTSDGDDAFLRHEPLGPILAIMPWNYPFWQFYRFAAPALMAGNTILLKHAPSTPRCALRIESLMREAGFPEGVVQSLFLSNEQASDVIADDRMRGVTLTGSTRAGREVGAAAGRQLKTTVLELGGSDPLVVADDADLDETIPVAVTARCQNSGQSCIAAKRILVQASIFDEFCGRFVEAMQAQIVGDPTDPAVHIGPLAREDLRDRLALQVRSSVDAGATALCGGEVPDRTGFFYPPTVLADVEPGMAAADDELFGPVAAVIPFRTDRDAVRLANGTRYGLGASVWTRDAKRALRFVDEIEAGSVFVNGLVKSDPRLPFGGVKDSGFGRELSREGLLEFVNVKTVWIR